MKKGIKPKNEKTITLKQFQEKLTNSTVKKIKSACKRSYIKDVETIEAFEYIEFYTKTIVDEKLLLIGKISRSPEGEHLWTPQKGFLISNVFLDYDTDPGIGKINQYYIVYNKKNKKIFFVKVNQTKAMVLQKLPRKIWEWLVSHKLKCAGEIAQFKVYKRKNN